jgi:hypothetical protein
MRIRHPFALIAILGLSARAFAAPLPPQPKPPPKGPPPRFVVVASVDLAVSIMTTEHMVAVFVPEQTTRTVEREGRKVQETVTVYRTVYRTEHRTQRFAGMKAFTAEGKPLSQEALGKRLAPGTVLLLSNGGAMPEEAYLKLFKPDTLVLVSQPPGPIVRDPF